MRDDSTGIPPPEREQDPMIGTTARTDEALVVAYARDGERGALETLVARHFAPAYRVALRALDDPGAAEDAAEETFVALIRGARRFDGRRPFGPWCTTLLLNAVRKQARSRARRERHERAAAERRATLITGEPSLEREDVEAHLARLPLDVRVPLILHYYEGHSHEQIAALVGCPKGTAASRIRRGLEQLRESLVGAGFGSVMIGSLMEMLDRRPADVALPPRPSVAWLEQGAAKSTTALLLAKAAAIAVAAVVSIGGASVVFSEPPPKPPAPTLPLVAKLPRSTPTIPLAPPIAGPPPIAPSTDLPAEPRPVESRPIEPAPAPPVQPAPQPAIVIKETRLAWRVKSKSADLVIVASLPYVPESFYPLPKELEDAFKKARALYVESEIDVDSKESGEQQKSALHATYDAYDSIERHVSRETLERAEKRAHELPAGLETIFHRLRPWAVAGFFETLAANEDGYKRELGIDVHFVKAAHEARLPIVEIEPHAKQIDRLSALPDELQEKLLLASLDDPREQIDALVAAWTRGSTKGVEKIETRDEELYEKLVVDRNPKLLEKLEEVLRRKKGDYFAVIGAGQLVGEKGLIELLKGKKYDVEQLSVVTQEVPQRR